MKTVLKYPGSKIKIADWICRYIPPHETYLELFFGGGAVFFNKEPTRIETINDLSGEVVNYFKILRDHPEELIRLLELTPYSREEYNSSFDPTDDPIERARRFAVRCWQGFGSSNKYKNGFRSGIEKSSPFPPKYWNQIPEVLREASERLKKRSNRKSRCDALNRAIRQRGGFYICLSALFVGHSKRVSVRARNDGRAAY